jgi:hypothetical protein
MILFGGGRRTPTPGVSDVSSARDIHAFPLIIDKITIFIAWLHFQGRMIQYETTVNH